MFRKNFVPPRTVSAEKSCGRCWRRSLMDGFVPPKNGVGGEVLWSYSGRVLLLWFSQIEDRSTIGIAVFDLGKP